MDKYGVVDPEYTPPAAPAAGKQASAEDLDDDPSKRLAEHVQQASDQNKQPPAKPV